MQQYPFRDLDNYKKQHHDSAIKKGIINQFMACETLTEARAVMFGDKRKTRHRSHKSQPSLEG